MPLANVIKGRNVKVEVGATYLGAPISVTAVSQANPGVATATAHGLADGVVGFFQNVLGMVQLDQQAVRIDAPAANTFSLQGLNTIAFPAYSGGQLVTVLTWLTLAESTAYRIAGGAPEKLDVTTLIDVVRQEENGLLAASGLEFDTIATTIPTAALQLIESAAQAGTKLIFRITLSDGAVRLAYGEPALPGEDVGLGAVGTGSLGVSVKGYILKLAP